MFMKRNMYLSLKTKYYVRAPSIAALCLKPLSNGNRILGSKYYFLIETALHRPRRTKDTSGEQTNFSPCQVVDITKSCSTQDFD